MRLISVLFLVLFFFSVSFAENDLFFKYPQEIKSKVEHLKYDFNGKDIEELYKLFVKYKGVEDLFLAYTLVEIAVNNKDKLDLKIVDSIADFYPKDRSRIRTLLLSNSLANLKNIYIYINKFTLYTFFNIFGKVLITVLFIYTIFANIHIFGHYHVNRSKVYINVVLSILVVVFLLLSLIFKSYIFTIMAFFSIVLYYGHELKYKIAIFLLMLIVSFLISFDYNLKRNINFEEQIAARPVDLSEIYSNDIALIKEIKNYKEVSRPFIRKISEDEIAKVNHNYAILMLIKGDVVFFESYIKKYNLTQDPIMLANYATFLAKNAMFDDYGKIVYNLNIISPQMHKVFLSYVVMNNNYSFYPYFDINKLIYEDKIQINYTIFSIMIISLLLGFAISLAIPKKFIRKICSKCGKIYCGECGDVEDKIICDECREIIYATSDISPMKIFKKEMDKNRFISRNRRYYLLLKFLLPGADSLYIGNIFYAILKVIHYSLIVFMLIVNVTPFIRIDNIGYIYFAKPFFYVVLAIFVILYFIDILRSKDGIRG